MTAVSAQKFNSILKQETCDLLPRAIIGRRLWIPQPWPKYKTNIKYKTRAYNIVCSKTQELIKVFGFKLAVNDIYNVHVPGRRAPVELLH